MLGRDEGTLFGVFSHIDFVGEDLPVLVQGYHVHLGTWVSLESHNLHPILQGEQEWGVKGDLSM